MKLEKVFNKIIEYGFYLLFFATPLIFNPSRNFPSYELFEWNKMIFVYLMTIIITSAWIGKMILCKKFIFKRTVFDIPLLLFLLSQSLSTLFSIDRHVSIFGYYSRFHGGLLSTISYLLLFYAYVSNFQEIKLKRLLTFAFSSAVVVVIYGILERFGIDADMWVQDVRSRVFSTLGQPNWLAAYLTILLPLIIYKLFEKINPSTKFTVSETELLRTEMQSEKFNLNIFLSSHLPVLLSYALIVLFYICLLFTKSRSGFLGFWGANAIIWFGLLWFNRKQFVILQPALTINWKIRGLKFKSVLNKIIFIFTLLWSIPIFKIGLIINLIFFVCNFVIKTPFPEYNRFLTWEITQKQITPPETTAPIGDSVINVGITDSGNIRKIVWQGAIDIAKAYPLFGTGPETFAYAYYKYRPAAHNLTSEWDFLYNKAHNEYLNFAATSGFLGLGTYLLLIIWFLIWTGIIIFKNLKKTDSLRQLADRGNDIKDSGNDTTIIALLTAYISILITNFFGFSVVIVGLYFFLIPAFVIVLNQQNNAHAYMDNALMKLISWQKISLTVLSLTVLYLVFSLSRYWFADSFYAQAISSGRQENYDSANKQIDLAINLKSDEPNYHDEKANIVSNLALAAFQNQDATLSSKYVLESVSESTKALKISPQNINFWKTRTRILFALAEINSAFSQSALDSINVTAQLAPTDAKVRYNVAVIASRLGKFDEAIPALQKAIELKPDYRDAYIALSIFYTETNQKDKAKEILQEVLKKINPDDTEVKTRLEKL